MRTLLGVLSCLALLVLVSPKTPSAQAALPTPKVLSFSPASILAGQVVPLKVTVAGSGFGPRMTATANGVALPVQHEGSTQASLSIDAALLAQPVVDTIKLVDRQSRRVRETLDRRTLWAAQTPQFALTADLREAHERGARDGVAVTDDAALLERIGIEVIVVASSGENFKVTLPEDVARAEAILSGQTIAIG